MRIIAFSDIHGNILALKAFLTDIKRISYDKIIFCGDIFGYYYEQKQVVEELNKIKDLIWINGNHDEYFLEAYRTGNEAELVKRYGHSYEDVKAKYDSFVMTAIKERKNAVELDYKDCKIGVFHGTPYDYFEGRLYPNSEILDTEQYENYDMVILGHTHCRMIKKCNNTIIINPGSLGQPRNGSGFGYVIIDTLNRTITFKEVKIDLEKLYLQIEENDPQLYKLKEVLEREKSDNYETNIGYSY